MPSFLRASSETFLYANVARFLVTDSYKERTHCGERALISQKFELLGHWKTVAEVGNVLGSMLQVKRNAVSTYQEVSSDQHSAGARPKLPHNDITLLLVHVAVLQKRIDPLE